MLNFIDIVPEHEKGNPSPFEDKHPIYTLLWYDWIKGSGYYPEWWDTCYCSFNWWVLNNPSHPFYIDKISGEDDETVFRRYQEFKER